ncbi:glycosyltransferase [Terriglobus roseus DSM 18391]|uniref:Glycosyltransferase n=1 Tax=Terriglobus roseus (strain DSM 18391 / NRRL B-41598 / KBS 63) TaxID=926566 RepID=I3ZE84_TERRK|nr:glycosyltransferase family 4 protein [Terriglobus roseus]AFL87552.1 glycosyltransferase [Terriglobus roseus DSM 18391]
MKQDDRPVVLFAAPYFAPAYHGGVVQVYLGLLTRTTKFRFVLVADYSGVGHDVADAWDQEMRSRYGITVERINSFEFHLSRHRGSLVKPAMAIVELARFFSEGRRQWKALVQTYKPAVIVCGGTYSAGWLMPCNHRDACLVNYVHGEELTMQVKPLFLQPWMRAWQRRCLRDARLNIAVSTYTAEMIGKLTPASPDRTVVLPNFIDQTRFHPSPQREHLRCQNGWSDKTILLTVARLDRRKGIDQALRALALLVQRGEALPSWRYVIGGRGAEREELQALTRDLGLTQSVSFIGFVPEEELVHLYQTADVFLQPNREINGDTEGFGVVFLEANACGLPVIGGIAGGTADAIDHGQSGLRVDGDNVEDIADAIALLMLNKDLRETYGRRGAIWASHFDVDRAASRFEDLLQQTLQQHRAAQSVSYQ